MPETDEITAAAKQVVDALGLEGRESQQAYRYLFARFALDQGVLSLLREDARPSTTVLICQETSTGMYYRAERPESWTDEADSQYAAQMRERILRNQP